LLRGFVGGCAEQQTAREFLPINDKFIVHCSGPCRCIGKCGEGTVVSSELSAGLPMEVMRSTILFERRASRLSASVSIRSLEWALFARGLSTGANR
jgi:hypothetical protein